MGSLDKDTIDKLKKLKAKIKPKGDVKALGMTYQQLMTGPKVCRNCSTRKCKDRKLNVVSCTEFKSWRKKK